MIDPLLRRLAELPAAEPDPARTARVRARCLAALARGDRRKPVPARPAARIWAPLVGGLGALYLTETLFQALRLYGVL